MKILLLGGSGQIGGELVRSLAPLGEVSAPGRDKLDLTNAGQIATVVRAVSPNIIVNAAAYTAVDRAEAERDAAFLVNSTAPGILAEEAEPLGALLVHYSTDYVFDGEKVGPYCEDDAPSPINVYGLSKLAGEQAIAGSRCHHIILRTSWVYGPRGKNFLHTILTRARDSAELRVVDDQIGAPTSSIALARVTATILRAAQKRDISGIYHLSAGGAVSWYEFARTILAKRSIHTRVVPVSSKEYAAAARRPRNSLLDNSRLKATFDVALASWPEGLDEVMEAIPWPSSA